MCDFAKEILMEMIQNPYAQIEIFRDVNNIAVRAAVLGEGRVLGVWKTLFNNPSRFLIAKALIN